MTTIIEYAVKCDVCKAIGGRNFNAYAAQNAVKQLGWVRMRWGGSMCDVCPDCQKLLVNRSPETGRIVGRRAL